MTELNRKPFPQQTPDGRDDRIRRQRSILIIMGIIILLLLLAFLILFLMNIKKAAPVTVTGRERLVETGILPGMTAEDIQSRLDEVVTEGMFNASMNGVVRFADGSAWGDVNIENIEANRYACSVEIFLKNTQECVLKTGRINPGEYVTNMPLNRPLVNGAFDCTAVFTAYDMQTVQPVGKVNMDIIILVGM